VLCGKPEVGSVLKNGTEPKKFFEKPVFQNLRRFVRNRKTKKIYNDEFDYVLESGDIIFKEEK